MAARSLGSLTLDLVVRMGGFSKGMDKAAAESERSFKRISASAKGIATGLAAGFAALGGANLFRSIIENTQESDAAIRQLEARLKSTGGVSGLSSKQLTDFASSLQKVTTFGDDAIVQMESLLLQFTNIRGQTVLGATKSILDLATAMGTDLNSAALLVGKALNDPVKGLSALSRAGVQFSEDQKKVIKRLVETGDVAGAQGLILDQLKTKFGGAAEAAANTLGGALAQLKNAFGDLLETDDVSSLTVQIQDLTKALSSDDAKAAAQDVTGGLIASVSALGKTAAAVLKPVSDLIVMANDLGAVLDNKVFGEQFSPAEQRRLFGVSPQGHGPRRSAVDAAADIPSAAPVIDVAPLRQTNRFDSMWQEYGDNIKFLEELDKHRIDVAIEGAQEWRQIGEDAAQGVADSIAETARLSDETFEQLLSDWKEGISTTSTELNEFQRQAARNTQDIIANTLIDGFDKGIDGILKSFGEMIKQLVAQAVAADISGRLFGKAGGGTGGGLIGTAFDFLGGLFGGKRAAGGPVSAGTAYLVGELGPEIVVPKTAGNVIPNQALGSMRPISVTNNFVLPPGGYSKQTQQQVAADVYRGTLAAARRNG